MAKKNYFMKKIMLKLVLILTMTTLSTLTIIIKCVFQKDEELHPLIYLDECLYEL